MRGTGCEGIMRSVEPMLAPMARSLSMKMGKLRYVARLRKALPSCNGEAEG
jgi:hypothetical protein